jgi:molecular chaperone DnaK (HSP70)
MSLLQIADPMAAPRPIGIDLGTTNSLVAYAPPVGPAVALRSCTTAMMVRWWSAARPRSSRATSRATRS